MKHASKFFGLAVLTMGMFLLSQRADAIRLLTMEEALKQMFPDVDQVITETVTLSAPEVAKVKARLGGQLVHYQAGSESEKVNETTTYTFYVGLKGTARIRMAVVDTQPGK